MNITAYLSLPVMAVLIVLQITILSHFPIFGVTPQILLLVALAWGLTGGLEDGLVWAGFAGLFVDLFSVTPLGVSSLAAIAAISAGVILIRNYPDSRLIMPALSGFVGTLIFWFIYTLLVRIIIPARVGDLGYLGIGQLDASARAPGLLSIIASEYQLSGPIIQLTLQMAIIHALLLPPVLWLIQFLNRLRLPRQVEI